MKKGRLNNLKINTTDLLEVKNIKDAKNLEMKSELREEKEIRTSKEILLDGGVASSKASKIHRITFSPAKKILANFNSPITTTNANNKNNIFNKYTGINHSNIESRPLAVQNIQSEKYEKINTNNLNSQILKSVNGNSLENQNFSPKNDKNLSKRFSHHISLNNVNLKNSGSLLQAQVTPNIINTSNSLNKRSTSSLISLVKNEGDSSHNSHSNHNNYSTLYANQLNSSKNNLNKPSTSNNNLGVPHSTTNYNSGFNNSYLNSFFNQINQNSQINQNHISKTKDKEKYNSANTNNNLTSINSYNLSNLISSNQALNPNNNINNINRLSSPKQSLGLNSRQTQNNLKPSTSSITSSSTFNNPRINTSKEIKSFSNDNIYHVQTNSNLNPLTQINKTSTQTGSNLSNYSINQSQNTTLTTSINLNCSTSTQIANKNETNHPQGSSGESCPSASNLPSVNIPSSNSPLKHPSNSILNKDEKEIKEKSQSIRTVTPSQPEGISVSSLINNQNIPLSLSNLTVYFPFYESTKCSSKSLGTIRAYAANTYQGIIRNYNEDRVSIILNIAKPNNFIGTWPKCSFFGIYDGHGGSLCADFLRDHLHSYVIKDSNFPQNPEEALRRGFEKAEDDYIYTQAMSKNLDVLDKSGSCAVVALIVEEFLYIANVGDSRAVMSLNSGKIFDVLTNDHKPNEEGENRRILANGGKVYQTQTPAKLLNMPNIIPSNTNPNQVLIGPYRVFPGRLSVSRTFGDVEAKISKFGGISGVIVATPEITKYYLNHSNQNNKPDFIVLGCDGIFDQISNKDIIDSVWMTMTNKDENRPKDLHSQCALGVDMIMKSSLVRRTLDNVTVLLIAFQNFENTINNYNSSRIRSNDNFSPKSSFYLYNVIENKEGNIVQSNIITGTNSTTSSNHVGDEKKFNSNISNENFNSRGSENGYCYTEPDLKRNDRSPGKISKNNPHHNKSNSRGNSIMSGTNEDVKVNKVKSLSPKGRQDVYSNYSNYGNSKSSKFSNIGTKQSEKPGNPLSNSHEYVNMGKSNKITTTSVNFSKEKFNKVFSFEVNNKIVQSPKNKKPIVVNYYGDNYNKLNPGNSSGSNITNNSGYVMKRDSSTSKSKRTNSKFEKNDGARTSVSNLTSFKKN